MTKFKIICILLLSSLSMNASEVGKAEAAYNAGNYDEAIGIYNNIITTEGTSAPLFYDLGNAYYKAGQIGNAVLCFERAKKLDPRNKSILNNLNFTTAKVVDANRAKLKGKKGNVDYDEPSFLQTINRMISEDRSSDSWAAFAVIAFLLLMGFIAIYVFVPNVLAKKTGFFSSIVFLFFTVVFIVFAFLAADYARSKDDAIITKSKVELLEKPEIDSKAVTTPLHEGTKVEILENEVSKGGSAEWYKVKLNSDNFGWINSNDLQII